MAARKRPGVARDSPPVAWPKAVRSLVKLAQHRRCILCKPAFKTPELETAVAKKNASLGIQVWGFDTA
jgi:hypothetical protein